MRAVIAHLADGLLCVGNQIQEDLSQLAGVAHDGRQIGLGHEIHGDAVRAQRVLMKLQAALNQLAQVHAGLVRLGRPRERQQVLHDLGGSAAPGGERARVAAG